MNVGFPVRMETVGADDLQWHKIPDTTGQKNVTY